MASDFYTVSILPFAGIIIKICRAYTTNQHDFEDYYQEVCLQIWRSKDSFKGQSEWSTWIYRLALNVCLTYLKKQKKNVQHSLQQQFSTEQFSDSHTIEDQAINQLYDAIRQLSATDRGVVLLYLEQKSYAEIAEIIGTNANNIGVRIKRIKQRLNKLLNIEDA